MASVIATDYEARARRDSIGRMLVLILSAAFFLVGIPIFFYYATSYFGGPTAGKGVAFVAFLVAGEFFARILPRRFLTIVPQAQALITENQFGGANIPYGPGLHPSYPWESVEVNSNISLELITQPFSIKVPTKTSEVTAEGVFQFNTDGRYMENTVGVDESTVVDGYTGLLKSFLTQEFAGKKAEDCALELDAINKRVETIIVPAADLGPKYGIKSISTRIATIKLPEAVQKSRDSRAEADAMVDSVARMFLYSVEDLEARRKSGEISLEMYTRMLNYAMAGGDQAKMNININEGSAGTALAAGLNKVLGS